MFGKGYDELWDAFWLVLMVAVDCYDRVVIVPGCVQKGSLQYRSVASILSKRE